MPEHKRGYATWTRPISSVTIPLCTHLTTMAAVYRRNDSAATKSVKWQSCPLCCFPLCCCQNYSLRWHKNNACLMSWHLAALWFSRGQWVIGWCWSLISVCSLLSSPRVACSSKSNIGHSAFSIQTVVNLVLRTVLRAPKPGPTCTLESVRPTVTTEGHYFRVTYSNSDYKIFQIEA